MRSLLVCIVTVAVVASCSTGDDASGDRATDARDPESAQTTTTVVYESIEVGELEALLPEPDDLGSDYQTLATGAETGTGPGDDVWDAALREACSGLYDLVGAPAEVVTVSYTDAQSTSLVDEPVSVERLYTDDAFRLVTVFLTTDDDVFPMRDQIDALIVAINRCDVIDIPGSDEEFAMSVRLSAQPDSNYGEVGMVMTMQVDLSGARLGGRVQMTRNIRAFQYRAVTAVITTVDGFDPDTFQRVRVDKNLASDLATSLNRSIRDLQDG